MKRLGLIAAAVVLSFVAACDFPYQTGEVIDREYNNGHYYLKLRKVVTHNEAVGWKEVSAMVYGNCQVGEPYNSERTSGCPDGSGGGGGSW